MQASKVPYGAGEYASAGRTIIAKHIINQAKAGERDPRWLADSALLHLSKQKLSRTPPNDILTGCFRCSYFQARVKRRWRFRCCWLRRRLSVDFVVTCSSRASAVRNRGGNFCGAG